MLQICFGDTELDNSNGRTKRLGRGNKLVGFTDSYCVVDIETTGLSAKYDDLLELAAIKVIEGKIVDQFSMLVKPDSIIDSFITELTGITQEMVEDAPTVKEGLICFNDFIGKLPIYCHNTSFDVNFIYDEMIENDLGPFQNDYYCTLQLSKKLVPELKTHRLKAMKKHFKLTNDNKHRALDDALLTFELLTKLHEVYIENNIDLGPIQRKRKSISFKEIMVTEEILGDNELRDNYFVFTGALENMVRKDAAQLVVNYGGFCTAGVTKKTNYLVIGVSDYIDFSNGQKTSKIIKAEQYKMDGQDINIIPETVFYDMLEL